MHGRLKVRTSEEEKAQKEKLRTKKVLVYKNGLSLLFEKRSKKEFDNEALQISGELLSANPDIYTLWNYRKEIVEFLVTSMSNEESAKLFDSELHLTEVCLKANPKSYCSWHHRTWVLSTRTDPDWENELKLCNLYLKLDERNFHCWNHRRFVVNCSNVDAEKEFNFSTEKIHENFSNYSAWHYRSKLLPLLYPDVEGVRQIEEKHLRNELETVINAAFTDPNDTSAWFYQRWLLGAVPKPFNLAVCRVTPSKSFITFNQSINLFSDKYTVTVAINECLVEGKWTTGNNLKNDILWIFEHDSVVDFNTSSNIVVKLIIDNAEKINLSCSFTKTDEYIGYTPAEFHNNFGSSIITELQSQIESCEQLLELEPDSKWTYLTLTVIKNSLNQIENYQSCLDILNILTKLDPKRSNYYKDLASRWHLEYILQNKFELIKSGQFNVTQEENSFKLSTLYHLQYWSACSTINLSGHQLMSNCLRKLYVFQNCQVLDLSNNCLDSLKGFPLLPNLNRINVKGNNLTTEDIEYLSICPNLKTIID